MGRYSRSRSRSISRSRSRSPHRSRYSSAKFRDERSRYDRRDSRRDERRPRSPDRRREQEDQRNKEERAKARDDLEDYCYDLRSELKSNSKIGKADERTIRKAVETALDWLDEHLKADADEVLSKLKKLESTCSPLTGISSKLGNRECADKADNDSDDGPEIDVGNIFYGVVTAITPYGVFVEIAPNRHGLVHLTQVEKGLEFEREDKDEDKVKELERAAAKGSKVWIKVMELRPDEKVPGGNRISCSMKLVSQEDGTDLDPEGKLNKRGLSGKGNYYAGLME
ncbi:hypothetical protein CYMTET_46453 [Cymbomonas tetramitiformis]|uniref:S1 motif domain-containing protein n=1 Tax=Cymbomonas tetramitiformis TaxID=36881 RepID=A0AAE0BXC4_9CHLO|nr:hypothetical protein CYMTET_46453 [Cymbomonas tetramitiformis]